MQHVTRLADNRLNGSLDINNPNLYLVISTENVEGKAIADMLSVTPSGGVEVHDIPAIHPQNDNAEYEANKKQINGLTKLENHLKLYEGQKVLFLSNNISPFVANNTTGIIDKIVLDEEGKIAKIKVVPDSDPDINVHPIDLARKDDKVYYFDDKAKRFKEFVRLQFPIKPALAANTYTVQGRTCILILIIDNNERLGKNAYGAVYVRISRVQDLDYYFPLHPLEMDDISVCPTALEFDTYHREQATPLTTITYSYRADGKRCDHPQI